MELYMVPSLEHGAQSLKKVFCVTVILCSLDLDTLLTKIFILIVIWCLDRNRRVFGPPTCRRMFFRVIINPQIS